MKQNEQVNIAYFYGSNVSATLIDYNIIVFLKFNISFSQVQ